MTGLTHFDDRGRPRMVDVSAKAVTPREAVAAGSVRMAPETLELVRSGGLAKGDVLGVATVAAVMGAKRTAELIPMCHPLGLDGVEVDLTPCDAPPRVEIRVTARCTGRTGIEMEALAAVATAALTIYDMCKAVDKGMSIEDVRLLAKRGGKSGDWARDERAQ